MFKQLVFFKHICYTRCEKNCLYRKEVKGMVEKMKKVGILMGSDSDLPVMQKAAQMLEKFGIEYEMTIISAHRMPDVFVDYAT